MLMSGKVYFPVYDPVTTNKGVPPLPTKLAFGVPVGQCGFDKQFMNLLKSVIRKD